MNKKITKIGLALGTIATAVAPVAAVVSCGKSSIDLTKNIIVLSQPKKDSEGKVTYPMDSVWNKAIEKFKTDHAKEGQKFNIKILHVGYDQYEKLSTVGITGQSMPDIWFFPSDKADMLKRKNNALITVNDALKTKIATAAGLSGKDATILESIDGKDIGFRFKNETVNIWGNKARLAATFPGDAGGKTMVTKLFKPGSTFVDAAGDTVTLTGDYSVEQFFDKIEHGAKTSSTDPTVKFNSKKAAIAKAFGTLDIKKVADVMATAAEGSNPDSAANSKLRSLLPLDGQNGWWLDALVYADGLTSTEKINGRDILKGLIWDQKAGTGTQDLRSVMASVKDGGVVEPVLKAWYELSAKSNVSNINASNDFSDGLQAFGFQGTWGQKPFSEGFAKQAANNKSLTTPDNKKAWVQDNLFAFPLPLVNGHQMRHYQQGWNFGLNARNKIDSPKYIATTDLLAELFSPEVQKIYHSNVEWYVPGNLSNTEKANLENGVSYVKPVLDIVSKNPQKYTVDQTMIDPIYGKVGSGTDGWGTIYGELLKPLHKNDSGTVEATYDEWANGVKTYLKEHNIHDINGR